MLLHPHGRVAVLALSGAVWLATSPVIADSPPPADHVVPVWYLGIPVVWRSFELGDGYRREEDIPANLPWPQHVSYIVGVADPSIGASPHQSIPAGPGGAPGTMPAHQAVITCMATPERPALGVAYAVVPGPAATGANLRSDAMPVGSIVEAPLATAIRIGPTWVPLTSHVPVDWGLRKDILRLRFFGANPTGWATANWQDNYPPLPPPATPCGAPSRAERQHLASAARTGRVGRQAAVDPASCTGCHGAGAMGAGTGLPGGLLAGQKAGYLREQLRAFRSGGRVDALMSPVAKSLGDEAIAALADHFSREPLPPAQAGEQLDPASRPLVFCVRCHGVDGRSPNDLWPNLAGQDPAYLRRQMRAYASGERQDDMMAMWGRMVDPTQLERILLYYSHLGREEVP